MPQTILVTSLRIEASSGPTCYPGENGFSAVSGSVSTDDPKLAAILDGYSRAGDVVILRCGVLEVAGTLEPQISSGDMLAPRRLPRLLHRLWPRRHVSLSQAIDRYSIDVQSAVYGSPQSGVGA